MHLIPFARRSPAAPPPAPPASPPAPPALSPARRALADHGRRWQAQRDRLAALAEPIRVADRAAAREAEAQAQLDAVAELEAANLRRWTDSPTGAIPPPLDEARDAAMHRVALAHAAAVLAARHAKYVEPDCRAAEQEFHELNRAAPALVQAVMLEEVGALAARVLDLARQQAAVSAALKAIALHAEHANDGALRNAVMHAGRGGDLESCALEQQALRRVAATNYERWSQLPARLADDPAAVVEITTRDPAEPDIASGAAA